MFDPVPFLIPPSHEQRKLLLTSLSLLATGFVKGFCFSVIPAVLGDGIQTFLFSIAPTDSALDFIGDLLKQSVLPLMGWSVASAAESHIIDTESERIEEMAFTPFQQFIEEHQGFAKYQLLYPNEPIPLAESKMLSKKALQYAMHGIAFTGLILGMIVAPYTFPGILMAQSASSYLLINTALAGMKMVVAMISNAITYYTVQLDAEHNARLAEAEAALQGVNTLLQEGAKGVGQAGLAAQLTARRQQCEQDLAQLKQAYASQKKWSNLLNNITQTGKQLDRILNSSLQVYFGNSTWARELIANIWRTKAMPFAADDTIIHRAFSEMTKLGVAVKSLLNLGLAAMAESKADVRYEGDRDIVIQNLDARKPEEDNARGIAVLDQQTPLTLQAGNIYRLKGDSGLGKTLCMQAIAGLWPMVESGEIVFPASFKDNPTAIMQVSQDRIPDGLGKAGITLYRFLTAGLPEDVAKSREKRNEVIALMREAGLGDKVATLDDPVNSRLSGGEQTRLLIIRAIAVGAKLLIIDEAFTSLDEASLGTVFGMIQHYVKKTDAIVLNIEHNPPLQVQYDAVFELKNQQIMLQPSSVVSSASATSAGSASLSATFSVAVTQLTAGLRF